MIAIEINDLFKKYGNKIAVNGINLKIKEGELFSLLGVNGAGKTTTIKMLTCLLKPTKGTAYIKGFNILKDSLNIKKIINISPQETAIAYNLSVHENLDFIANIYQMNNVKKRIKNMIKLFKLEEVEKTKAKKLSGGFQRRLSIAMSLITDPEILFLDEPTLGLDVLARRELWRIIEDLKGKITIVLTTHYMEEAEILSDNIAIMAKGKIIETGTSKQLIKKAKAKNFEDAFVELVERNA